MKKKVLVTGGGGYIGGYLCNFLVEKGYEVIAVDIARQKYLKDHPSLKFYNIDIRDKESLERIFVHIDAVFHLAFIQTDSNKLSKKILREVNIEGTKNVLDLAVKHKVNKFIFTSSAEVYGANPISPIMEDSGKPLDNPLNNYSLFKIEAENLAWEYYHEYDLPLTSLRFPMVCGDGFYNYKILMWFVNQLKMGRPYIIVGNGANKLNEVSLDDVLQGYYLAYLKKEAVGKAFNISADAPLTLRETINFMKSKYNSKSLEISIPLKLAQTIVSIFKFMGFYLIHPGDLNWMTTNIVFDNNKAKKILGFKPTKNTLECIEIVVDSFLKKDKDVWKRDTDKPYLPTKATSSTNLLA